MNRTEAALYARTRLNDVGLKDWGVRIDSALTDRGYLGLCSYSDKCIIINAHHAEIHGEANVKNTINHEVAHALCFGHHHDEVWAAKAKELGCDNTEPCSSLGLPADVIN